MSIRRHGQSPHHPLARIQELVAEGEYDLTGSARADAELLALDEDDIVDCIHTLREDENYSHSLAGRRRAGTFQDVYRTRYCGFPLYIKLQLAAPNRAAIISFKRVGMTRACPECGADLELARVTREVQTGQRMIPVEVEVSRCTDCGEILLAAGQVREMQRRAAEIARHEDGLLTPEEIQALRKRYGLSQEAFERLINAGPKTVTRWERGTVCQNGTADTLMRVLRDNAAIALRLAAERGVDLRLPFQPHRV